MVQQNKMIETYLLKIKKASFKLAPIDDYIQILRYDLYEFLQDNPDCTEADLVASFGEPEDIAKEFLNSAEVLMPKVVKKSKKRRNIIIAFLIIILLAIVGYIYYPSESDAPIPTKETIIIHKNLEEAGLEHE